MDYSMVGMLFKFFSQATYKIYIYNFQNKNHRTFMILTIPQFSKYILYILYILKIIKIQNANYLN